MHRRTCLFRGRVQGVGFRYSVKNLALQYDVRGYVRNLPDGGVELVMEGPDDEMDRFEQDIRQKMSAFIQGVETSTSPAASQFTDFSIRH